MTEPHRIFRKKPGGARVAGAGQADTQVVLNEANRVLLERYAPPSVLVDQNFDVVQFNGRTRPYLEPAPKGSEVSVLKLARGGLLHGLRTALQTARATRKGTRRQRLRVRNGNKSDDVDIEILPIVQQRQRFYLVLFEKPKPALKESADTKLPRRRVGAHAGHVAKLEEEVATTREYLQSTIQEIEAANEELQSANEEILSTNELLQGTNEELDTAKEELQSVNEELSLVNDELLVRNEELTRVNADLVNLLATVPIAIVIVSHELRIRRFTPMAEKVFHLTPGDIGRPFSQIGPNIVSPELLSMIAAAIDTVTTMERPVQDSEGRPSSLRIRPCKNADGRIDGAVIALFDREPAF